MGATSPYAPCAYAWLSSTNSWLVASEGRRIRIQQFSHEATQSHFSGERSVSSAQGLTPDHPIYKPSSGNCMVGQVSQCSDNMFFSQLLDGPPQPDASDFCSPERAK